MVQNIDVELYRTKTGTVVFSEWIKKLNKDIQAIIDTRIARIRGGNFGDCKRLSGSDGIFELRIHFGPGFRVYYGMRGNTLVILLCGKEYWKDYLTRLKETK